MSPQQQYRLRLGDGTLLLVDRDALNTWRVDDRATVQPVGSKKWRGLRAFLANEQEAAFFAAPAVAADAPTAVPGPPKATRLEDVLVPPPPKNSPVPAPTAPEITAPPIALAVEPAPAPEAFASPSLSDPLPIENAPFIPAFDDEPPAALTQPVENLLESLQEVAAAVPLPPPVVPLAVAPPAVVLPVVPEPEWAPPAETAWAAPEEAPEPEELTDPRLSLQEYDARPAAPRSIPLEESLTNALQHARPPAEASYNDAPPRRTSAREPGESPLQVLADDTSNGPSAFEDAPVIALRPIDEPPAAVPEPAPLPAGTFAPTPRGNVVENLTEMLTAWSGIVGGWVNALDRRPAASSARTAEPSVRPGNAVTPAPKPVTVTVAPAPAPIVRAMEPPKPPRQQEVARDEAAPLALEPIELEEVIPEPAGENVLAGLRRQAASAWTELARSASAGMTAGIAMTTGWLETLRRLRPSAPAASAEPQGTYESPGVAVSSVRAAVPAPPRVEAVKPPTLDALPALKLAKIEEPPPAEEDWVYDGAYGPSLLDTLGTWARRAVIAAGLVIGGFVAYNTWETWLPKAGQFGQTVVTKIEDQVHPAAQRREEALQLAAARLPHLSAQTIDLVMSRRGLLEPVAVFHVAHDLIERGMPALPAGEASELRRLQRDLVAELSPLEQVRVRDYERVRRVAPSTDDATVLDLFARAAILLTETRRQRLHLLSGKAIAAGLDRTAPQASR